MQTRRTVRFPRLGAPAHGVFDPRSAPHSLSFDKKGGDFTVKSTTNRAAKPADLSQWFSETVPGGEVDVVALQAGVQQVIITSTSGNPEVTAISSGVTAPHFRGRAVESTDWVRLSDSMSPYWHFPLDDDGVGYSGTALDGICVDRIGRLKRSFGVYSNTTNPVGFRNPGPFPGSFAIHQYGGGGVDEKVSIRWTNGLGITRRCVQDNTGSFQFGNSGPEDSNLFGAEDPLFGTLLSWSVGMFAKLHANPTNFDRVFEIRGRDNNSGFFINWGTNDVVQFDLDDDVHNNILLTSATGLWPAADRDWHYFVCVKDAVANRATLYFDGVPVVESFVEGWGTDLGPYENEVAVHIGHNEGSNDLPLDASHFVAYDRALTAEQVMALYNAAGL